MTNRWELKKEPSEIAERLASFPEQVGAWKLSGTEELSEIAIKLLECDGYLARTYVDENTGDVVKVAIVLGPAGPVAVHTPEICYSSREFAIEQTRQPTDLKAMDGSSDELWRLTLRSRDLHARRLRVYYGWSTDGTWRADANPRFSFAGEPFLVKLQIAGRISQAEETTSSDSCLRFLREFAPQLRSHLFVEHQAGGKS